MSYCKVYLFLHCCFENIINVRTRKKVKVESVWMLLRKILLNYHVRIICCTFKNVKSQVKTYLYGLLQGVHEAHHKK